MDIEIRRIFNENQKPLYSLDKLISEEDWRSLRNYTFINFEMDNPQKFCDAICKERTDDSAEARYMTQSLEEQLDILETLYNLVPRQVSEERNAGWITKLKEITRRHEHLFVAVGSAHLVGETGLLQWLQNSGYLLERANSKGEFEPFNYNPRHDDGCVIQ